MIFARFGSFVKVHFDDLLGVHYHIFHIIMGHYCHAIPIREADHIRKGS
jgi:hypothetical protein